MYLQEISPRYTAESYSLLTHNCNNFSNEVAQFLVGTTIPEYILQLPNEVMSSPMGALIMPMIQNLETTLRSGAVPQTPQFKPAPVAQPAVYVSRSSSGKPKPSTAEKDTKGVDDKSKSGGRSKASENGESSTVKSGGQRTSASNGVVDPLGDARSKVQEEITAEFAAIMATGTLRASEAAALATKRVMQRHGNLSSAMPQS